MGLGIREEPVGDHISTSILQAAAERMAQAGGSGGQPDDFLPKAGHVKLGTELSAVLLAKEDSFHMGRH